MFATHGIFSGAAKSVIKESPNLCKIIVTNSLPQTEASDFFGTKLEVVDISGMVSEFIRRSHYNESVSVLSQGFNLRDGLRDMYRLHNRPDSEPESEQLEEEETISLAEDLSLRRIRKGFRLESICWD